MSSDSGISEATIFTAALGHLGQPGVISANENSEKADVCRSRYANLRNALIRSYRWNFSTIRASLPEDAVPPAFGYAHRYRKPTDCLKVFQLVGQRGCPWKVEGDFIVTDATAPLQIIYAQCVTNAEKFDPIFIEVLAMDLAIAISGRVANKRTTKLDLTAARREAIETAEFADADEGEEEEPDEGSWLEARRR